MKNFISFFVGVIFALGLGMSGMTKPSVVISFLDVFGDWDYSLLLVMIGAILFHSFSYFLIRRRQSPLLEPEFLVPTNKVIDAKLIFGALLFGIGWGLGGICPGPAIVSLATLKIEILIFVVSMFVGMKLYQKLNG